MKITGTSFIGTSIRSILDGSKTMTRRDIKVKVSRRTNGDAYITGPAGEPFHAMQVSGGGRGFNPVVMEVIPCPYGVPGDRLWVKETFSAHGALGVNGRITYRADLNDGPEPHGLHWKPSRFMPRAASRITLEITSIRVEQLGDISDDDCEAEGIKVTKGAGLIEGKRCFHLPNSNAYSRIGWHAFKALWETVNGKGSWNPKLWVWVIGFKVLEK